MYYDHRDQNDSPATKGEKAFTFVFILIGLGLFAGEIVNDYEPKKLSALLFILFWAPLLVIHELGHALMAKWLGWHVDRIVLGIGKVLFHRYWFNAPVEIRSVPLEGFVQISPKTMRGVRWKHALIYFAGPGIELFCVLLIAIMLGGFGELFNITDDYTRIALQSFAFAALAGAVMNLVPQGISTKDGNIPNDGMGILLCLFSSGVDYEKWVAENRTEDEARF